MRHVGFLAFGTVSAWANRIEGLRVSLRELGHFEGHNIVIRSAERKMLSNCRPLAAEVCVHFRTFFDQRCRRTRGDGRQFQSCLPPTQATQSDHAADAHGGWEAVAGWIDPDVAFDRISRP